MDLRPPLVKVVGIMGFDWSFNKRIQRFQIRATLLIRLSPFQKRKI